MLFRSQFLAPETISTANDPRYMKIGTSSKVVDYLISGRFRAYRTRFLSPGTISTARDPGYMKIGRCQNSSICSFLAVFVGYGT